MLRHAIACFPTDSEIWLPPTGATAAEQLRSACRLGCTAAVARRLGVPDLTTTVLALTPHRARRRLRAGRRSGAPARPGPARPGRRILSVPAMFLSALVGAVLQK
ncbi:hypothetical protein ACFU8Q_31225, partial [Streptomyces sp. NPDC057543]